MTFHARLPALVLAAALAATPAVAAGNKDDAAAGKSADTPAANAGKKGDAKADKSADTSGASCLSVPDAPVSLSYGSRYTDKSKDRSDIDKESNAKVNEVLGPIDDFISELTTEANAVALKEEGKGDPVCVVEAIYEWADAGAFSKLKSMNAQLSAPSRIGAIALDYLQVLPSLEPNQLQEKRATIEKWLDERAHASVEYFDGKAPPKASRNNLRAWAGLAAAAAGLAADDDVLISWAAYTNNLVACSADEDGALPLEMARGPRALHYQLHATAPLVTTAALLKDKGYRLFDACDGAIGRIVSFVPKAFGDPKIVEEKAGESQTYFEGKDELKSFELAWAAPYLSLFDNPELERFVADYRPLGNSKLGGDVEGIW